MPSLIDHLRDALQRHAHRTAVEGATWLLSYRDLERESQYLAALLLLHGVRPGHRVPVLMGRSPQFIVAMLAILRCGAAYAPIDLASPPARQIAMLAVLDAPVALVDADADLSVLQGRARIVTSDALERSGAFASLPLPGSVPWPDTPDSAAAYAMFTSGSTGAPKCVLVPHGGIRRLVCNTDYAEFRADARWTQLASLAFDAATLEIWAPLLHGACCVIQEVALPSLDDLADYLVERHISDGWLTAALFNAIVDDRLDALGGMRQLALGGERISVAHSRACLARWPHLRLINGYGPTENTTFSLCHTILPADVASALQVPIGRPINGTTARIAPLDAAAAAAAGELPAGAGELWVAGAGVAIGYLNDPEQTRAKFVEDGGERWYRTGDLVWQRDDGVYEFIGRADRQVKIQGHRVELEEVERVFASCPGVGNAVVMVQGDSADSRHLVGLYSGLGGPAPADRLVRDWLLERLSPKAVPSRLTALARLPLNLNGKVDRPALLKQVSAAASAAADAADAWQTDTERQLAQIWSRCLPHARFDRQSHFTRSGGSSLLALRVAADVGRSLQRQLDALDVLRVPVLAEQARLIDGASRVQASDATAHARSGGPLLSRSQKSLLQASRLDASGSAYLVHIALLTGPGLAPERLRRALEALARRHPLLRTAAQLDGDAVSARVLERAPRGWWTDQGELAAAPAPFAWPAAVLQVINRPLDSQRDAAMRANCWRLPEGRHLCVWTVHHFAMDAASIDLALGELDHLLAGAAALAPVYGSPFAFAALEAAWTDDAAIQAQAVGVAQALAGQVAPLPAAPRPGGELPVAVDAAASTRLAQVAQAWGCTPFTPLVVAYGLALQQVFGPAWRHVLTPFSRRVEPELVEPIGCLLDVRLIEAGARPGEALPDTLARVHAELLEGQQARFRPFDRLADAVAAIDPGLRSALTQFSITWRPNLRNDIHLGGVPARVLTVPQTGARFGLTLHLETDAAAAGRVGARLEAIQEAIADGRAAAVGQAFARSLAAVCALQTAPVFAASGAPRPLSAAAAKAVPAAVRAHAQAAWQQWLGRPPAGDADDFLRAGGSSLLAMRLSASLRRSCGVTLDLAAFLAGPSFGALCAQLVGTPQARANTVTLLGTRHYERVMLVLPGGEGGPLGMYRLAEEMHRRLPETWAVAIVDLPAIMARAPDHDRPWFFTQQLLQVVRDLGEDRVGGVVGFSLGGLMGIDLLNLLGPERAAVTPLWMIDTYAPQRMRIGKLALTRRVAINLLRHPLETGRAIVARLRSRAAAAADRRDGGVGDATPKWRAFMSETALRRFHAPAVSATLIHSVSTARGSGLFRHIATNGFAPGTFGRLQVIAVEEDHFELPRAGASRVAGLITGVEPG